MLKADIESVLNERYKDQKAVEYEVTERVVEKVTGWAKILLYLTGFALAALLGALSILGFSKLSDLGTLVDKAKTSAQQRMDQQVDAAVKDAQQKLKTQFETARQNAEKNLEALVARATKDEFQHIRTKLGTIESKLHQVIGGFDTAIYPGDTLMKAWKESSPYQFVSYYLPSPCHSNRSWTGKRASLMSQGWEVIPVYVGSTPSGPCARGPVNQ